MVPGIVPLNISRRFMALTPFALSSASGVAVVTPSYVKLVICPANEISRKHLAPRAGFMKFCPRPVTMALQSLTVTFLLNKT